MLHYYAGKKVHVPSFKIHTTENQYFSVYFPCFSAVEALHGSPYNQSDIGVPCSHGGCIVATLWNFSELNFLYTALREEAEALLKS